MGVIKEKGIRQSIVTYIGVLIGVINTIYIYPKYFLPEEFGLFRFLIDTSILLLPFVGFGLDTLSIRIFPVFKNKENGHNGLLLLLFTGIGIGYLIFALVFYLTGPYIDSQMAEKSVLIQSYWRFLVPLAGLLMFSTICRFYVLNFKHVVVPTIFSELYLKIGLPIIAVCYYFGIISLEQGVYLLLLIYAITLLSFLWYIYFIGEWRWKPNWKFLNRPLLKEMANYSLYGLLGNLGSILAIRIDVIMVAFLAVNDLKDVGVYSIALFIANVITIPARAINSIASPIISESWERNDSKNLEEVYKKSSIVSLTLGLLFMIGIWCSIDDLFSLMPNGDVYSEGKYVILIIGLGRLFDLMTGSNHQIIAYSKHYRFNFYAVLILALFNIISNFIFIPIYQINGAALATMSSLLIYNFSKLIYIKFKMGFQPFSINTINVLIISAGVLMVGTWLPQTGMLLLDVMIRSAVIAGLFISLVLYFKISNEFNIMFLQLFNRIKQFLNR